MARNDVQELRDGEVCGLLAELTQAIGDHTREVARGLGLTEAQAVALRELSEPLTLGELARRMRCKASNATFVADRLEVLGLLERRPHPSDRRAKRLHLTREGTALRRRVVAALNRRAPLAALDPGEQRALRDLLTAALGQDLS